MKTALFLGAGASDFAGQPTTKKLMSLLRKRIQNDRSLRTISEITEAIVTNDYYTDVEKLYDGIDVILRIHDDRPNTKPIFLTLEGRDDTFSNTLDELKHIKSIIRDILLESFVINASARESILSVYDKVLSDVDNNWAGGLRIFTTNYDTVIEEYAHVRGFEVINGFREGIGLTRVWADNWDRRTDKTPLYLMKLHGSINWHKDTDGNIVETGGITQRDANNDIMIAPTEGAKDYGREPFTTLLERFKESIRDFETLLVIGFSYRDEEIANIIKERLDNGMALISVSPTAFEDIRRLLDDDIKAYEVYDRTFEVTDAEIVLIKRKVKMDTIGGMLMSLGTAYEVIVTNINNARSQESETLHRDDTDDATNRKGWSPAVYGAS